ncbi:hypothetical protein [Rufibacter roseus]|uniref:Uncharacterized protein n=1 Tax=Rufibacter roseus TaxID=1567108 RepID=A0ABW2DST0_9BACT|nr:hypothetical protein [Rufibacter roseus]
MKNFVYTLALVLFVCVGAFAQNTQTAEQRARNLSDKMIRDLQLNNYQSKKLRAINLDKAKKMAEFERMYAGNPAELEKCYKGLCKERDKELEDFLSTAQYSQYYSTRKSFNSYDQEYALKLKKENAKVAKTLVAEDSKDAKRTFPQPEVAVIKEGTAKN